MASSPPDDLQILFQGMKANLRTQELVKGVDEGDEVLVKSALAKGALPEITVPTLAGVEFCLVCLAASRGHDHLLLHLLMAGLSIEGRSTDDKTPMMLAAERDHTRTLKALISCGANPHATDRQGRTALHFAAMWGWLECVAALLPVTPPTATHQKGDTPVHSASYYGQVQVLELLAGAGWPLTAKDGDGRTALHLAALGGHVSALKWLVRQGCDLRVQDKAGCTLMDIARRWGRHEVQAWLVKNGAGDVTWGSEAPLVAMEDVRWWRAVHEDQHSIVLSILMEGNKVFMTTIPEDCDCHVVNRDGLTPLHVAALLGASRSIVETLLRRGASPHVFTPDNLTPADLALEGGHRPVIQALHAHQCPKQGGAPPDQLYEELLSIISLGDQVQEVSRLLCMGALLQTPGGVSALRLAVITDRPRTVSLMLASGVLLSASLLQVAWYNHSTAQMLASLTTAYCCRLRAEQRRLVQISGVLVEGISSLLKDIEGDTPWQAAWRRDEDTNQATFNDLLVKAAAANCPLIASFLHSAGARPFYRPASGDSALHAALDAGHQDMAEFLVSDLGACPYVPDSAGRLPLHIMTHEERRQHMEQWLFEKEREKLMNLELRQKGDREKAATQTALEVQRSLFNIYKKGDVETVSADDGRTCLLLAVRKGLLQLTHLLLREGRRPVDDVLNKACGTTALHEAASHGEDGCVMLLVRAGANIQQRDTYGQTPRHLAAMFGHTRTVDFLAQQAVEDFTCRAGTTAKQVTRGFEACLQLYEMYDHEPLTPADCHHPNSIIRKHMKHIKLGRLQQEAQQVAVDLSRGEALQIRDVVMAELKAIMDKVSAANPTYRGDLRLVGSSRDGSKLYAPDDFDVNIVVHENGVGVNVSERCETEARWKGRLEISVETDKPHLQGNNFMASLYEEVHRCLTGHTLQDKRLSLVPPGLSSTQVGVGLALAWQGQEYPLLLVCVDLVPVLEVPWPEQILRPFLTPEDTTTIQLSNAADTTWHCSFALTEAKVLEMLSPAERQVQLMGKVLLSFLKAKSWTPRHIKKSFCTRFNTRDWNILVPSEFCFKSAFLRWLEHRRLKEGLWEDPARWVVEVFRLMCANNHAYFGGDCEGRKHGDGAPIIVQCLEEHFENLWCGSAD